MSIDLTEREEELYTVFYDRLRTDVIRDVTAIIRRFIITLMVVVGLIMLAIFFQSYEGRITVVAAQRTACERGKLDRSANAEGWRAAQTARQATADDPNVGDGERKSAKSAAKTYDRIADGLETRARINCSTVFPSASPLPWR